ncbi:MAG: ARMT1-like domain-containing protein [Candidatus Hydrogenedentota bacterium]
MKTNLECIPCLLQQALKGAQLASSDEALHEQIVRTLLTEAAEMDLSESPPALAQKFHRRIRELSGVTDPYLEAKRRYNQLAARILPDFTAEVEESADPFFRALRLAIAGNVIDLGVKSGISEENVEPTLRNVLNEPFHGDVECLRNATQQAGTILYIADNAGEIVLDRLLIERLPFDRLTLSVRGSPVLNDATRADAETAGLTDLVEVIDTGSDAPGAILADCSEHFRRRFQEADLIIAKGQGNYETLSNEDANLYFLFKVKCPVVSADAGFPMGTHALVHNRRKPQLS